MGAKLEIGERAERRPLSDSLRLLCICRQEPSWTGLALQLDRLGCTAPRFQWCSSQARAATLLRDESFDVILVGEPSEGDSDPIVFIQAIREAGTDEPILVVSPRADDAWLLRCGELNLETLTASSGWESRALAVWIRRAIERAEVDRDYQRLQLVERRQLSENREGTELIAEQWRQVFTVNDDSPPSRAVDAALTTAYGELLRTYAFLGAGRLRDELDALARRIEMGNLTAADILRLHCGCLKTLLSGCGSRSVRHLQQNGDLFAVEVLTRVADGYRSRSALRGIGDHGIDLLHAATQREK